MSSQIKRKFIKQGNTSDAFNAQAVHSTYTPSNYTPAAVGTEATTQVSAHLKGLDAALLTSGDITGNTTLANNQSSVADVTGLLFDGVATRSVLIKFAIYRNTSGSEQESTGNISLGYKTTAADWTISTEGFQGNAGITFSVTSSGQVQYISTNMAGTGYVGTVKWLYKTISV